MCGIAGFLHPAFEPDACPAVILAMLGLIAHRGPDEHGYFFDDAAAFGVARLAVIDHTGGKQPMTVDGERYWIAYNGEIYNYRELRDELISLGHDFRTQSDTEVVLQAWLRWRHDSFARFNGGFAVAIYDRVARRLVLARDRWGKRPLYYTTVGGALVFASEMKAMLAYPGAEFRWSPEHLQSIFTVWTPLPDETAFAGIHQVLPGTCLVAGAAGHGVTTCAAVDLAPSLFAGSETDAQEVARSRLSESVRLRLRSDVEVGIYLSGGLDSAIVTRLATENSSRQVHTFSVGFAERRFDESADQEPLSRELGTRHTSLRIENHDIVQAFPEAVWFAETPVFRTAFVPMFLLSRMVREHGITVVLTGEGADEVFLGYDIFKETLLRHRWTALTEHERHDGLAQLYRDEPHFRPENFRSLAAVFNAHSGEPDDDLFSHQIRFRQAAFAQRLLTNRTDGLRRLRAWIERDRETVDRLDAVGKAQWLETVTLLSGYLLSTQGDRMSFANGVENRCPFLDLDVVPLASSLPVEMRLKAMIDEKHILKQAFARHLPPRVIAKPKRPYLAPDAAAFAGPVAREYLAGPLSHSELSTLDVVNVEAATSLAEKFAGGSPEQISPRETQAFTLMVSLVFLDRYFVRRRFDAAEPRGTLVVSRDGRAIPARQ